MNKIVFSSFIFLISPFCFACNPPATQEFKISIVRNEESEGNFTYTLSSEKAKKGADLTIKFLPDKFYDVNKENVHITINKNEIEEGYWSYNDVSNELKILGQVVTGDVVVDVTCDTGQYVYKAYVDGSWTTNPEKKYDSKLQRYVVEQDINKDVKPESVNITIAEEGFTLGCIDNPDGVNLSYDEANKQIVIGPNEFYRDITITLKDPK